MTAKEYFDTFGNLAIVTTINTNLFPSVKLAMSAIESNYGKSYLATEGNNYFGIKSQTNPNNFDVIIADDDLPNEGFRKYKSIYDGWIDATAFLVSENPRYETAIKQTSPGAQIDEIMKAGYATAQYLNLTFRYLMKQTDNAHYNYFLCPENSCLMQTRNQQTV